MLLLDQSLHDLPFINEQSLCLHIILLVRPHAKSCTSYWVMWDRWTSQIMSECPVTLQSVAMETHLGSIAATSLSVFCLSTSSSSVLSRIRSSRLDEYCSNMRSMLSMMFVFFPLLMLLNCNKKKKNQKGMELKAAVPLRLGLSVLSPVWKPLRKSASSPALHSRPVWQSVSHPAAPRPPTARVGTAEEALWPCW